MSQPPCPALVRMEALLDYWAGDASIEDAERLEDHAWTCDACARRLAGVARLGHGIARVARRRGGIQMVVTQTLVDRLAADGLQMRHYRIAPGETVACTVGHEDDLLVTYLSAELGDADRVDVVVSAPGSVMARIEDAPIDAVRGEVIYTMGGDLARTLPAMTVRVQLLATSRGGEARTLAEYTLEHTPAGG